MGKRVAARGQRFFLLVLLTLGPTTLVHAADYPPVVPGRQITFPADEGSHPDFRLEWWYVTGWLEDESGRSRGFQVTFFRNRPGLDDDNRSRFAARQLLFAHAAVSDPAVGHLLHDERAARAGFGLAETAEGRAEVVIEDWSLRQDGQSYTVSVPGKEFELQLKLDVTQAPLLQGDAGFSQKGPDAASASYYYSLPNLAVAGSVTVAGRKHQVRGAAWFDHEWSSTLLDEAATGWDWLGINLNDGGALMAFRMRNVEGDQHWAGGTIRKGDRGQGTGDSQRDSGSSPQPPAASQIFSPNQIEWLPLRRWRSPHTRIEYPVAWRVRVGDRWFEVRPLFDDQESDSRRSTGTIYWEGAVELIDDAGAVAGRGYLELTGYGSRLRM